jgi:hypothetical protein
MTGLGAALAAVAAGSLVLALRRASSVARRLDLVAPPGHGRTPRWRGVPEIRLRQAGLVIGADRFLGVKIASGLGAALVASLASLVIPIGPALVALAAYAGFIAPSLIVDQRAAARRAAAEREVAVIVERLEALVVAGRPPETGLALLVRRPTGADLLDHVMRRTEEAYTLGAPLFRTLAAHAREEGLTTCAAIADDLERARDLGTGSIGVIRERRTSLRAAERTRSLEAAAQVEGKLMLILVLCYLPALVLLVVVPLFIGLLEGLLA